MKYRELVEGQSEESSIFCLGLMQLNNDDYQKVLKKTMEMADLEVPEDTLNKINECRNKTEPYKETIKTAKS